ncbi:MAG: AAA family ATPase [Burkholderiales bacterium]|nr:AAA family ATPase [Burkholderiales bacterium]
MKIRTLFLKAFGPFTDTTLDFSGPAGLHLIYGANEAGKSSALRAITDLRYGIPMRSKDDFVHEFKNMRVSGCFEDVAGRAVGLTRRKGNNDTLAGADPLTGLQLAGGVVPPEVLLALTGGVAREQFETMYGLNSRHLRKGGQLLIQGEGELGAALFEASTGSAGIRQMLQTLQEDAKKYFNPRSKAPILNEALRQLDEARQRYRLAVTKPDQWKILKREHEAAELHLATVRQALAGQRRRQAELAELRAVEPLLQQLALNEQGWAQVESHVALPEDARERRLAALQQQAQARKALADAEAALADCRAALQALRIEPLLLTHAPAIDRLVADLALVRRGRDERLRLQAEADSEAAQLLLQAAQIMGSGQSPDSLDAFFRLAPAAADQAELARLLDEFKRLTQALENARKQLDVSQRKLDQHRRELLEAPALPLQQALALALGQAQLLGDAPQRLASLQAALGAEQRLLAQALLDLGLASPQALTASRWLPAADIDAYEQAQRDLAQQVALRQIDMKKLQTDLALQQRRHKSLCATGEVVTAETLRQARELREAFWQGLRSAFIDPPPQAAQPVPTHAVSDATLGPSPEVLPGDLPNAFERSQAQADRQADLLREGAARAAEMAECEQRIAEMTQSLAELQQARAEQAQALAALDENWQAHLARLGLAPGTAALVREWQARRKTALECHERLTVVAQDHDRLAQQISAAAQRLLAALGALGLAPPDGAAPLPALIALGADADRRLLAQQAAIAQRASDMASLAQDIADAQASIAELTALRQGCQSALDGKARLLYLGQGAAAETLKARLAELQHWTQDYQRHGEHLQQVRTLKDSDAAALGAASALGQLVQEPVWEHQEAWLDALVLRLDATREAVQLKAAGERSEADEVRRQQGALADLQSAAQALAQLVAQAGVQDADALQEAETRSEQRRTAAARLQDLQAQLAQTSARDAATLRAELAGLDRVAIDGEKQACAAGIARLEADEQAAIDAEQATRIALARIDTSDDAAQAREEMEAAIARYRAGVRPWAQLKLAEALLGEALRRHREKAQGPVVALAGDYFRLMTGGRFARLLVDADSDAPVLLVQPAQGKPMDISALSEGTADQLYLALRLAALEVQRQPDRMMPLVLDDVFMTADDERAAHMFGALAKFAAASQVLVFTHHHHLLEVASRAVGGNGLRLHRLESAVERSA